MAKACQPRASLVCIALALVAFAVHVLADDWRQHYVDTTGLKWIASDQCQWVGVAPNSPCPSGYEVKCCNCTSSTASSCKKDDVGYCVNYDNKLYCPSDMRAAFCVKCPENPANVIMIQNSQVQHQESTILDASSNKQTVGGTNNTNSQVVNSKNQQGNALSPSPEPRGLTPSELAGIIIGSVGAAAGVVAAAGYFYYQGRRRRQHIVSIVI